MLYKQEGSMKTRNRYKFIIMYQALPTKAGKERQIDKKLEESIKDLVKLCGYRFVGSGYNLIRKQRDMEFEANR